MYPLKRMLFEPNMVLNQDNTKSYVFEAPDGHSYRMNENVYHEVDQADGTHPLNLSEEVIERLKQLNVLTTERIERHGLFFDIHLWMISEERQKQLKPFCTFVNRCLPFAMAVSLVLGILAILRFPYVNSDSSALLSLLLLFLSVMCHELGHFSAGVAYDCRASSIGAYLLGILPIIGYARVDYEKHLTVRHRVQLMLAGIEVNFLLAGLCMVLTYVFHSETLLILSFDNLLMGIVNLMPAFCLDGDRAISVLFGVDSLNATALSWLFSSEKRRRMLHGGVVGYVWLVVFSVMLLADIALVLVLLLNIRGLFTIFLDLF